MILSTLSLLFPAAARSANAPESPAPVPSFQAFEIIAERNIFNPNRSRRFSEAPPPPSDQERESQDRSPTESIALLGTLSYDQGRYAYFDGSRSEYRAVLKPSDTIAGYTVAAVTVHHVKLTSDTNEVVLPVGMQLARDNEGPWRVTARGDSRGERGESSERGSSDRSDQRRNDQRRNDERRGSSDRSSRDFRSSNGTSTRSSTNAPAAEDDEILKALMKKREQELNNETK